MGAAGEHPARAQTAVPPLEAHGIHLHRRRRFSRSARPAGTTRPGHLRIGHLVQGQLLLAEPEVGQQITDIYVNAVSMHATSSAKVNLAGLTPPTAGTTIGQVIACPATGTSDCDAKAVPVANGLDQASLRIQLVDTDSNELSSADTAYGRVYYRDEDGDLLTGLIPADGTSYLRVSPYAGAFSNDGSEDNSNTCTVRCSTSSAAGWFGYVSTTSTDEQEVTAYVGGTLKGSDPATVDAITIGPGPAVPTGSTGAGGGGFYLTGCTGDYFNSTYCRIARHHDQSRTVPHQRPSITKELRIGLQLTTTAQTFIHQPPLGAGHRRTRTHRRRPATDPQQRRTPLRHHIRLPKIRHHRHLAHHPRRANPRHRRASRRRQLTSNR